MEKLTGSVRPAQTSGSGHVLTPEEASLLREYLLGPKPLLVMSNETLRDYDVYTGLKKNATSGFSAIDPK